MINLGNKCNWILRTTRVTKLWFSYTTGFQSAKGREAKRPDVRKTAGSPKESLRRESIANSDV